MAFRREQLVLEDGRLFGEAVEPWQEEHIFRPLDERDAAGHPRYRLAYIETPRGQGKTTMAAAEAISELVLGGAGRRIYCFANDEDQAGLLHEAAAGFVGRNPLLGRALKVERRFIRSPRTGSYLRVMAADAASAHGLTPDLVVFDELHALQRRDLWDAVYSAIVKKRDARMIVITTPGWRRNSICWEVREGAQHTEGYYFWSAGGRVASWLDPAELERQRAMLPAHVFQRLHEGRWTEGEGAFIAAADLARCLRPDRVARTRCDAPVAHVLAVDFGLTRDRTAIAVVHRTEQGVALDLIRTWQGSRDAPVQITTEVEPFIRECLSAFPQLRIALDPWQAQSTFERLRAAGADVQPYAFSGARIDEMTRNLYALAHSGNLELYDDAELMRELLDVQVVERGYGLRIDHHRDAHDDRVIALAMAAHVCVGLVPDPGMVGPDAFRALTRILPIRRRPSGLYGPLGW